MLITSAATMSCFKRFPFKHSLPKSSKHVYYYNIQCLLVMMHCHVYSVRLINSHAHEKNIHTAKRKKQQTKLYLGWHTMFCCLLACEVQKGLSHKPHQTRCSGWWWKRSEHDSSCTSLEWSTTKIKRGQKKTHSGQQNKNSRVGMANRVLTTGPGTTLLHQQIVQPCPNVYPEMLFFSKGIFPLHFYIPVCQAPKPKLWKSNQCNAQKLV